ncbi:MAG TPA: cation:proton antiporter [Anaerolineales bacterium]|nr:cation:proton antiporter [Anaerolineales bacterium]
MSTFLQLAFLISVILFAAKFAGYLSIRLGQPSVLGELLVGILLGPSLVNLLNLPFIEHKLTETIAELAEFGVLLLMFIAGLELHFSEMRQNLRVAVSAGFLGVFFPVLMGWGAGRLFGLDQASAIFLGLTLGATSVSISAQTLIELKALRSRVGLSLLGAAVFDDILVILFLSVFLGITSGGESSSGLILIVLRMFLFIVLAVLFGLWALPWIARNVTQLPISQGLLTISLIVMLVYGIAAEFLGGMAAITGAFLAGLMLARCPEKERIESGAHALAYALFVPLFFVNIGLSVNLRQFHLESLLLTLAIIAVAVISKWVGAGLGARLGGLTRLEATQLGAGMISRGEVGLIVANVGIQQGLVFDDEFSAIVMMVLVSTLITPPILRALFVRREVEAERKPLEAAPAEADPDAPASYQEEAD